MFKFNKDKFEVFVGWVFTLIVLANIFCPAIGIITGVLLTSQNYIPLMFGVFAIITLAYVLTVNEVAKLV